MHLLNISTTKVLQDISKLGKVQNPHELKVLGCIAYSMIYSPNRQKLDHKTVKCIFIRYSNECKAYKLYSPMNGVLNCIACTMIYSQNKQKLDHKSVNASSLDIQMNTRHINYII